MKAMCFPGCYDNGNGFVTTHALGHLMHGSSCVQMHELPQGHCGDDKR